MAEYGHVLCSLPVERRKKSFAYYLFDNFYLNFENYLHRLDRCMGMWIRQLYRWTITHPNKVFLQEYHRYIQRIYHTDRTQRNVHSTLSIVRYKILVERLCVYYFDRILFKNKKKWYLRDVAINQLGAINYLHNSSDFNK